MSADTVILAGLGNPGGEYEGTRHNIGFIFVDHLVAQRAGFVGWQTKHDGLICSVKVAGHEVKVIKPQRYMNRSGEALLKVSQFYKIEPHKIVVVHDEVDLPLGSLRLKQ
ncbi:MAG: aminoacyl-tRNA hydrolase, partial [Bdellovibrionales bacterium]|nr:aminoacyl-tRNA hydrolase [Bdellovibrionales bacterium]